MRATILLLVVLVIGAQAPTVSSTSSPSTERVSVDSSGNEGNSETNPSYRPSISSDGQRVAFWSNASNLVPGDTNGYADVFVRNRGIGTTERVTLSSTGGQTAFGVNDLSMSGDASTVAFQSFASTLVPDDTNGHGDIFVRDRLAGTTERVSVDSNGNQSNGTSHHPAANGDGRFTAFMSAASNLVPNDSNGAEGIFVRDRQNGVTERVSVAYDGSEGNRGSSGPPRISDDGRFVAFASASSNLVPGDQNVCFPEDPPGSCDDIFVRDRLVGTTELITVSSSDEQANNYSQIPVISADGRFVAFESSADNLVPGDTNGLVDIFVRDRQLATTELASISTTGTQANQDTYYASISGDGRLVAFYSAASNLILGDLNGTADTFVHDRATGMTIRTSLADSGAAANDWSMGAVLSQDGRFVAFHSLASNLVPGDLNGTWDLFIRDLGDADGDSDWDPFDPDDDNDTWSDVAESTVGTNPLAACGTDAWPPDINNSGSSDITDIAFLTGSFGESVPPASARGDIAPDPPNGFVDTMDIARMTAFFALSCPAS